MNQSFPNMLLNPTYKVPTMTTKIVRPVRFSRSRILYIPRGYELEQDSELCTESHIVYKPICHALDAEVFKELLLCLNIPENELEIRKQECLKNGKRSCLGTVQAKMHGFAMEHARKYLIASVEVCSYHKGCEMKVNWAIEYLLDEESKMRHHADNTRHRTKRYMTTDREIEEIRMAEHVQIAMRTNINPCFKFNQLFQNPRIVENKVKTETSAHEREIRALRVKISEQFLEINSKSQRIEEMKTREACELEEKARELEILDEEKKKLCLEISQLQQKNAEQSRQLEAANFQLEEMKTFQQTLAEENDELKKQATELESRIIEVKTNSNAACSEMQGKIEELESKLKTDAHLFFKDVLLLRNGNTYIADYAKSMTEQCETLMKKNKEMETFCVRMGEWGMNVTQQNVQVTLETVRLQRKTTELEEDVKKAKEETETLKQENAYCKAMTTFMSGQFEEWQRKNGELEEKCSLANKQIATLTTQVADLKEQQLVR